MRIGLLTRGEVSELHRLKQLGLGSMEWVAFAESPAGPRQPHGDDYALQIASEAAIRGIRISAIGAFYRNALDPAQSDWAREVIRRAIDVAARIRVPTVSAFPGAIIEPRINDRGGNPIYEPSADHLPRVLAFWEPLADYAQDHGIRIAFEHCPQGLFHLPVMGYNLFGQPALWERLFDATRCENLGLEWDPSHLVCQFIDPVQNLRRFGSRVFHVHAKDAFIDRALLTRFGVCHPGVAEHRFPGLGECDWAQIVHELHRQGYDSDLNIEGWHDPVFRDHEPAAPGRLAGKTLEDSGVLIARRTLEPLVDGL
jgi:sugar phosphate isomerase/epimerase